MEVSEIEDLRERVRSWALENASAEIRELGKNGWTVGARNVSENNIVILKDWQRKVYDAGFLGVSWPREYGGRAGEPIEELVAAEEFTNLGLPYGGVGTNLSVAGPTILAHGNQRQKRKYIPKMIPAEDVWCQGLSEPGAGSDLAGATTRATMRKDYYEITGQKIWTSWANVADHMIVLARTSDDRHSGFTAFIVDPFPTEGITISPITEITGHRAFSSVYFDKVRVSEENIIGQVGDGWRISMTSLNHERVINNFYTIALAEKSLKYLESQGLSNKNLMMNLEAVKALYHRFFEKVRVGKPIGSEGSALKICASELFQRTCEYGIEYLNLSNLMDQGWFQVFLASRASTIGGGTSEILRNVVAERVLQLPK